MDIVYDVLKTWYLGNQEDKRNKKQVLSGFRGKLLQIVTEIEVARLDDSLAMTDLKHSIPFHTSEFSRLLGTYEFDIPIEVSSELNKIRDQLILANKGINISCQSSLQEAEDALLIVFSISKDLIAVIEKVVTET